MFILVCAVLLMFPGKASIGAVEGIRIAWENVIASILPFLVFAQALIYTGECERWARFLAPFFRFLRINEKSIVPFVISFLAGYPSGGKIVCDMYKEGEITKKEAESFLAFCNNGGIVFAVSVIGGKCFESYITGICVFACQVAGTLVSAKVFSVEESLGRKERKIKKIPKLQALGESIASSGAIIGNILASFIVFHALINALEIKKIPYICGIVELTGGIIEAGKMNNASLATFFFVFGSLSVFVQVSSFSAECNLSLKKCFWGKLLSACVACVIMSGVMFLNY